MGRPVPKGGVVPQKRRVPGRGGGSKKSENYRSVVRRKGGEGPGNCRKRPVLMKRTIYQLEGEERFKRRL